MKKAQQTEFNRDTIKLTAKDNDWVLSDHDKNTGRLRFAKDNYTIEAYPTTLSLSVQEKGCTPRWFKKAAWYTISRLFYCPWISTAEAMKVGPITKNP
ncbi:hypothetical protein [Roseivirga seohaensis]|uniref:hypothetical protein n=1 Tax=Roseivirga seohaensis TaxID=1914963 RepID=UPI003BABC4E1